MVQLGKYQRRAMLYPGTVANMYIPLEYLGDLAYVTEREVCRVRQSTPTLNGPVRYKKDKRWYAFGENAQFHANFVLEQLTSLTLFGGSDSDTERAFNEAKEAVEHGVKPEDAWPSWYCRRSR